MLHTIFKNVNFMLHLKEFLGGPILFRKVPAAHNCHPSDLVGPAHYKLEATPTVIPACAGIQGWRVFWLGALDPSLRSEPALREGGVVTTERPCIEVGLTRRWQRFLGNRNFRGQGIVH